MAELFLIAARAANGTIGRDGALPWHIPADLGRFRALTMGKPMIMGRRTFESLPTPLPGRRHIVLTRDPGWRATGAEPAGTVAAALALAGDGAAAVIGGAQVFALFDPLAGRFELTQVHADVTGDTFLPAPGARWREAAHTEHPASDRHPAYAFVTLLRDL